MKKNFYLVTISLLIVFLFCNCHKKKEGIVFSFDDGYVEEWYNYRALFKKYDIHATFFIARPHLLDSNQISKLNTLKSDGHEIACHAYLHKKATHFQLPEEYIDQEIKPALQKLQEIGFKIRSFAYPFGISTPSLDSMLLYDFKTIRKATYNIQETSIDNYPEIYAKSIDYRIVNAIGIDYNFHITPENFEIGVQNAIKNNEILIVYAHKIDTSRSDYTIHPEYLENLFRICKKNGVKSITMDGMYHYFEKTIKQNEKSHSEVY